MEVTGYTDRFSVAAGETVAVKLSVEADRYEAQLVELLHGDEDPRGPGFQEREVPSKVDGTHPGRVQRAHAGSCVVVDEDPRLGAGSFAVAVWAWPTLPAAGHRQALVTRWSPAARSGWALALDDEGRCGLWIGPGDAPAAQLPEPLPAHRWSHLRASYDAATGVAVLERTEPARRRGAPPAAAPVGAAADPDAAAPERARAAASASARVAARLAPPAANDAGGPLLLAARAGDHGHPTDHFNGKLEAPVLRDGPAGAVVAAWDLGGDSGATTVRDTGPHQLHGRIVNRAMRAVTGHAWTGDVLDSRFAPDQYRAIAFHEDDLDDAGWATDLELTVPAGTPSGVYALRVRAGGAEDHVPFVVRAPRDRATADVALVIPTFSYLAYANDHVLRLRDEAWKYVGLEVRYDPLDELVDRHPEWGRSLYDTHRDGSGCCVSSRLRPIVNLRPRYRWWASGGAQYLASDLYVVHWLRHAGIPFDLLTDEDVHAEGAALLDRYRVVLTGTHPEYVTAAMLDAFEDHLAGGGRLMYLGGNGFYWVTSVPPDGTHVIEVRRGNAGTRAWDSRPGEEHHAFTGERGGLWRHRGRSPNALVGIGFAAQGWSDPSPGYRRTAASHDPAVSWIFDGVDGEVIGDFGLAMNGAAGDELDRYDAALGSPEDAVVLASSEGHSRYYTVVHEDLLQSSAEVTGETNPNVRADLTYRAVPGDGAVFATGSKSWCASLSWAGYDNSVARVTENVLRRFLRDA